MIKALSRHFVGVICIYTYQARFKSTFQHVNDEVEALFRDVESKGIGLLEKTKLFLSFALRELLNNAVEHGNQLDESKFIFLQLELDPQKAKMKVSDGGKGFPLTEILQKEEQDSLTRVRNRGIAALTGMGFVVSSNGNTVVAELKMNEIYEIKERKVRGMEFKLENDVLYCILKKNLVASNVKEFVEMLKSQIETTKGFMEMVIDLKSSESIDSMGITFLIGTYKTVNAQGKKVKLSGVSDSMLELFKIMKIDEVFDII
jgi:anti-anti-sigma factor